MCSTTYKYQDPKTRYHRYYQRNREKVLVKGRAYYHQNRDELNKKQREKRREKNYGTLLREYENLTKEAMKPRRHDKKAELAYVAGVVDGEGTLTILKNKNERFSLGFALHPILSIPNTNRKVLEFCRNVLKLPNSITFHKRTQRIWRKDFWRLDVTHKEILLEILIKLRPYLVIKRKQADLLMQYCLRRLHTQRQYDEQDLEILSALRKLNHRGKIS